MAVLLCLVAF